MHCYASMNSPDIKFVCTSPVPSHADDASSTPSSKVADSATGNKSIKRKQVVDEGSYMQNSMSTSFPISPSPKGQIISSSDIEKLVSQVSHGTKSSRKSIYTACMNDVSDFVETESISSDEDETWEWDDMEQLDFQTVKRFNVSVFTSSPNNEESDIVAQEIMHCRQNGIPFVIKGHAGWAQFSSGWLRKCDNDEFSVVNMHKRKKSHGECHGRRKKIMITDMNENLVQVDATNKTSVEDVEIVSEDSDDLLDLSDPNLVFDAEAMMNDIGNESVPVVRRNYDEMKPINGNIKCSTFIKKSWLQNLEGIKSNAKLYLHQWQFPLSDDAGPKLCHMNSPLPSEVLGDDLLKYWLDLPSCEGDNPLQYIFMGREDTYSKLHADNGGLVITIAPIVGLKECTLVHRNDGPCLYNCNASILKPDLHRFPLLSRARIWKTILSPGEILIMPEGTFHQCCNITPCLSYSRFHLDTINLPAFIRSFFDNDAPEIQHDEILWNATYEMIQQVDSITDDAQDALKVRERIPKLGVEKTNVVKSLRNLRHAVRDVARRMALRVAVKGVNSSFLSLPSVSKSSRKATNNGGHNKRTGGGRSQEEQDLHDWNTMVDDVDFSLHEFRFRRLSCQPVFHPKRMKQETLGIDAPLLCKKNTKHLSETNFSRSRQNTVVVAYETDLERAYMLLPNGKHNRKKSLNGSLTFMDALNKPSIVQRGDNIPKPNGKDLLVKVGDIVYTYLIDKEVSVEVLESSPSRHAAYLSFEEYPSIYDAYQPFENLRSPNDGEEFRDPCEVKSGMLVLSREGKEAYRAIVQHTVHETILRVKYLGLKNCNLIRWIPISSVTR